jgi:hypothetical protein
MFSSRGSSAVATVAPAPRGGIRRSRLEVIITPAAVGVARQWTADQLASAESLPCPDLIDDAVLVVSELVTNALAAVSAPVPANLPGQANPARPAIPPASLPPGGKVRLVVTHCEWGVRIEVFDSSTTPLPPVRDHPSADETGRGLMVVDGIAARWGWRPSGIGKVVWCELEGG